MTAGLQQRMAALRRANEVRCGKAQAKRDLAARKVRLAQLLDDEHCQSGTLLELLLATPTVGHRKATRMLRVISAAPSKQVRALTDRQRSQVLAMVAAHERLPSYRSAT